MTESLSTHLGRLRKSGFVALVGACLALAGCGSFASRGLNSEGVRMFDQTRYQDAVQRFQHAIDQDPNNADSYYNLAATYHRLGTLNRNPSDLAQAERYYNLCLDRNPDNRDCYRGLAVLLVEQDRSEEAFRLVQGWADRSPTLAESRIELARLYEEFGDPQVAKQHLVDALAIDDKNPRALAALGKLREQMGEQTQALAAYQRSLYYDRFQPDVQARVAALQSAVSPSPWTTAPPGDTRTVTRGTTPLR